jgi:putative AlgH/UPF0301 family transcriptional regulator
MANKLKTVKDAKGKVLVTFEIVSQNLYGRTDEWIKKANRVVTDWNVNCHLLQTNQKHCHFVHLAGYTEWYEGQLRPGV